MCLFSFSNKVSHLSDRLIILFLEESKGGLKVLGTIDLGDQKPRKKKSDSRKSVDKKSKKSFYGTATKDEREELSEEGIDLLSVPWVSKDN